VKDEEKLENIARELCRAAGQDPDAKIRLGEPLSFAIGECTIVKPLIVPAWKAYSREARRLSMSDAEHAEAGGKQRPAARGRRGPARTLRIMTRRWSRRLRLAQRLKTFCADLRGGAAAWARRPGRTFSHSMREQDQIRTLTAIIPVASRPRRLFASRDAYRAATRGRWTRRP
jgi:hypothetical protein